MRTERKNVRKKFFPNEIGQKMLHEKSCGAVLFTTEKGIKKFLLVESNYFAFRKVMSRKMKQSRKPLCAKLKKKRGLTQQ